MAKVYTGMDRSGSYRVYLVDSTPIVRQAQDIHQTTPLATAGLGRVLTGAGIMSLLLKEEKDRLTVIFRGDGPAQQILAVGTGDGSIRGYIANPEVDLPLKADGHLDVGGSLGTGELTVIKDIGLKDPWNGTIALVSGEIAEDLTAYYYISEQQNTSFALGVKVGKDGRVAAAGGLFIQMLPGAQEKAVDALETLLADLAPITTYVEEARSIAAEEDAEEERLVAMKDRIFGSMPEDYRPGELAWQEIRWACDCSREKMANALATIGETDLTELIEQDHGAELTCQFCRSAYRFSEDDLREILRRAHGGS